MRIERSPRRQRNLERFNALITGPRDALDNLSHGQRDDPDLRIEAGLDSQASEATYDFFKLRIGQGIALTSRSHEIDILITSRNGLLHLLIKSLGI